MFKSAPSVQALQLFRTQVLELPSKCQYCKRRTSSITNTARRWLIPQSSVRIKRNASHIAPVTIVNASQTIPLEYRELHEALKALSIFGATYSNASQLQLALRGLESTD